MVRYVMGILAVVALIAALGGCAKKQSQQHPKGYATMDENFSRLEYEGRIGSIGVPIMTDRKLYASTNVIYLNSALTPEAARDTFLGPLKDVARRMALELEAKDTTGTPL